MRPSVGSVGNKLKSPALPADGAQATFLVKACVSRASRESSGEVAVLSLSSLAGWEDAVLTSIAGARGSLEERDQQIERSGMYAEYPAILRAYLELLGDDRTAVEALKRSVFLVWRSAMASPAASGIASFAATDAREVVEALDALYRRDGIDAELWWMLAWYHEQGPFVLELYGAVEALRHTLEHMDGTSWRAIAIIPSEMSARGQMGRYWSALATGAR